MNNLNIWLTVISLTATACSVDIPLPNPSQPGKEEKVEISLSYPDAQDTHLSLTFGVGKMNLSPGSEKLVSGTATYNYAEIKPRVVQNGGRVEVTMGDEFINRMPSPEKLINQWDFYLGTKPMDLVIGSGAYKGNFEFGGLALTSLNITDGAADVSLAFSEPNQIEMSTFSYATGASTVSMFGLANANFSLMDFSSGAGNYTLDFSGELQRDASVKIESGLSNMNFVIPEGVDAVVTVKSGLSNVNTGPGWSRQNNVYRQEGESPTLTILVEIGAGHLSLTK